MSVELHILGSSSASPTRDRSQSGQILDINKLRVLIDCGEGTQYKLIRGNLSYQKIDIILISHLHGDHYLGLFGLLNTMSLNHRTRPLHVYSPGGLKELIDHHFRVSNTTLRYELIVHEILGGEELIYDEGNIEMHALPVQHRVPCYAYLIREKTVNRKLNMYVCEKYGVSQENFKALKRGEDLTLEDGSVLSNELLTFNSEPPFSYAYVTDTIYLEELARRFSGVQVLYHEATFLDNLMDRAEMTYHSTAAQAARFASKALVNQLIIGHFSSRYDDLQPHLEEARALFPNTELAEEGRSFFFK